MQYRLLVLLPALGVVSACSPDGGLTKFNSIPEAQIVSHGPGDSVRAGADITLRGAASDANHASTELSARWFVGGVEVCGSAAPDSEGASACVTTVPDAETLDVRFEVADPEGAAGVASLSLPVVADADPVAEIVSPTTDGVYYSDAFVTFRGVVSDAEDAPDALVAWWEDGATRLDQVEAMPNGSGEVLGYALLGEGPHALELHVRDSAGNESIATVLVDVGPPNAVPVCEVTAPASGGASALGARVDFEARVSDADVTADALDVVWTSDRDGVIGTSTPDSSGYVSFRTAGLTANDHRITLTVTDDVGATCTTGIDWTVGTPPSITLESPLLGEVVNEGEALAFAAVVSDAEDVAADLIVTWESDLDGVIASGAPDSAGVAQFITGDLSPGDHVLTVTVTDSAGLYATALGAFTVNGAPSAPVVTLSPALPDTDDSLSVGIVTPAVDPEGDALSYAYAWYRDGVASTASSSATLPASATARGEVWRVEVWASDGLSTGATGTATVTIGNALPVLGTVSVSPSTGAVGDVLTCGASASDPDGDTPAVSYVWSTGATGATLRLTDAMDPGDVLTCTATATDDMGATASGTATATVRNSDPVVTTVTVTPASGRVGDTLTCAASASDPDGGSPSVTYAWSSGATGATYTLGASDDPGDVVTCTATAADADGGSATGSASATVQNTGPVLGAVTITPGTATNSDTVTCTASATDADGGAPTLSFAWTHAATGASLGSGASLALTSALAASLDTVTCTATALDADGGVTAGTASITLSNRAPTATASISPAAPSRTSTLTCAGAGSDADGDATTASFAWTVDGAGVAASSTGAGVSTLASGFTAGDSVACTVTVSDGKGGTGTASASVTIGNAAPVVSGVTLSPGTVRTNDTITASASASDPDGDGLTLSYAWYVDGALVTSGASSTLSGATYFNKGQVVYVVATASDGVATGSATSSSVTVSNTAPTAPVAAIDPADPVGGEDLFCTASTLSSDADGDPITYSATWTVGGTTFGGPFTTTLYLDDTVDGAYVDATEVWVCTLTASDGTATASDASDSVTVAADNVTYRAGYYWVVATYAAPRSAHAAVCSSVGLTATSGTVSLTWDATLLRTVATDFGYAYAGDTNCCAQSMWCWSGGGSSTGAADGSCETHNFGSSYENYGSYSGRTTERPVFTCR
jgi:hypothetical protein